MRIIKPGKKEELKEYEVVCPNRKCQALIGVRVSEMKAIHDQRDGSYYEFKCPDCSVTSYLTYERFHRD